MSSHSDAALESVLERFARAWKQPTPPRLEDFLPVSGDARFRQAVLRELVGTDLEQRLARGEPARLEGYLTRFPELAANAVLDLAVWEFNLRRQQEPDLSPREYQERFPPHADALGGRLASARPTAPPATGAGAVSGVDTTPPETRAHPPAPPTDAQVPKRLGSYELLGRLGKGGMGEVYRARHVHLDKLVALKVIRTEVVGSPELAARFRREALAAGRLEHANLVRATDAGDADGTLFLAMELLQGEDLARRAERLGPLPVTEACEAVRQAAMGLHAAHAAGLIHRDVKPHNLFLCTEGVVKVLDLGLARLCGEATLPGKGTAAGSFMGTPDYAAPEQFVDASGVEATADIYALGCTLYHLLAGTPPFGNATHPSVTRKAAAHLSEPPPDLQALRPEVPQELAALVAKMLAKKPEDRPRTAAEIVAALAEFTGRVAPPTSPPLETPIPSPGRGKKWLVPAVVTGVLLAGLLVLGVWALSRPGGRARVTPPNSLDQGTGNPMTPAKPLTIRLRAWKLAQNGFNVEPYELGEQVFRVRLNDKVEVRAELSEPAYGYVLAFNPIEKAEGLEQLINTEAEHRSPERTKTLSPGQRITLNDGEGLQVFAVVASRQPLPPYAEWHKNRAAAPWKRTEAKSGVVVKCDGKNIDEVFAEGVVRGKLEPAGDRTAIKTLGKWLMELKDVEAVAVVGFAVDAAE